MKVSNLISFFIRIIKRYQNLLVALLLLMAIVIGIRLWSHASLSSHAPFSTAVYDANGRLLRLTLSQDERYRLWMPLEKMPKPLIDGVLLQEDQWFYYHPGFNPFSLIRGGWITYIQNGNRQGGSTLTMQLSRLMYRLNTRSPMGKLKQIARSVQLELYYSKHDILEAYLNYAPYGRNIEGVGAASVVYFDKKVSDLSLPEALTLAVIPQDPTRRLLTDTALQKTDFVNDSSAISIDETNTLNQRLIAARDRLYRRWSLEHPEDLGQSSLFMLQLHLRQPENLPFLAPHFVDQLLRENILASKKENSIISTLDAGLQRVLENQIKNYITLKQDRGIRNAVAMLVDTRDMSIKSLVGSANFFDSKIQGQVNGTLGKRSPGSTLKPFIYALAMDQGILHPSSVLKDVPTSFGPFTPENFDSRFLGPVTATDALIRSRNIPAVAVASKLSQPNLYDFLRNAGVSRMASEQFYGLALVLGGGEVTMEELARLYAMLANRGILRPLRTTVDQPKTEGTRLLSDEASFMVMDMLRQNPRPDNGALTSQPSHLPIYWKTGTSWGFRDAWTAGIVGPYVLIVWIGNFDGSGNPAFIGVEAAAPLFFRIVDALRAHNPQLSEPIRSTPANVKKVEVCLASGDLPNAWCPQRGFSWFIPGKSPIRVSTIHRPVVVDKKTNLPVCPPFDPETTRTEVYEYWPSDLAKVFSLAGIARRKPPPLPDCASAIDSSQSPQITAPLRGVTYTLRSRHADEDRIGLNATADASARTLYWFVDDAFVGQSAPGDMSFWKPATSGEYLVRTVDDYGRSDSREVQVEMLE